MQQQMDWYKLIYAITEENINSGGPLKVQLSAPLCPTAVQTCAMLECMASVAQQCLQPGGACLMLVSLAGCMPWHVHLRTQPLAHPTGRTRPELHAAPRDEAAHDAGGRASCSGAGMRSTQSTWARATAHSPSASTATLSRRVRGAAHGAVGCTCSAGTCGERIVSAATALSGLCARACRA